MLPHSFVESSRSVELKYTSQGFPDLYLHDRITLNCFINGFQNLDHVHFIYRQGANTTNYFCFRNVPIVQTTFFMNTYYFEGCLFNETLTGFHVSKQMDLFDKSPKGNFSCEGVEWGDEANHVKSNQIKITSLKG